MTWPSRRIRVRCPASGEPTWMTWLPRLMIPAALTSRCTSTQLLAASGPGAGPAGGGPAGRAPALRSQARSTADSRDGTVLIRHPAMLSCTVVVSIQNLTVWPVRVVPGRPPGRRAATACRQHDYRKVSSRGGIQVARQRIQAGLPHAGKIVTIELGDTSLRIIDDQGELITAVPRRSDGEISRFKAYGTRQQPR